MPNTPNPEGRPPRGLVGDIHRARTGATATAGELREFVAQFRGRTPQEMLGIVAGSGLIRSTALAALLTFVFLAAFTVGPYLRNKSQPPVVKAPAETPAVAAPAATGPAPAPAASTGSVAATAPAAGVAAPNSPAPPTTAPAGPVDPLSKLGVSEVKNSDPKKNPLENSTDDIFKDLKK